MIHWYFDFISPYAYLQSTRLTELARIDEVKCTPVLFAGLLNHWGNVGPGEIDPKRAWTFRHVAWLAHQNDIELKAPSSHPFNPLPLLRLAIVLGSTVSVVQRLFRYVWAEGYTPADKDAFSALLDELDVAEDQLRTQSVKETLVENGQKAISRKVFGVPTLERAGQIFWGFDATDMAIAYFTQQGWPAEAIGSIADIPVGIHRKR